MPEHFITICGTIALALAAMATNRVPPELALLGTLSLWVLTGLVGADAALSGFSSPALHTVALLLVVSAGIRQSGALNAAAAIFLGRGQNEARARGQMMSRVALLSAFLNNTPIVALLLPSVRAWCHERKISPSRFLIPLSYASILGGTCTLIGTSTNLVVRGLLPGEQQSRLEMFTLSSVALPAALLGLGTLAFFGRYLLPNRTDPETLFSDPRAFLTEAVVVAGGPVDGRPLGELRVDSYFSLHPVEVIRNETVLAVPRDEFVLRGGDRLILAGPASHMVHLHHFAGLRTHTESSSRKSSPSSTTRLVEVVISAGSPLVGNRVGEGSFRRHYGGAVIAVARHGEALPYGGITGWRLQPGDTLLVEADAAFSDAHRKTSDFIMVTERSDPRPAQRWHPMAAFLIVATMVSLSATGTMDMLHAAVLALAALLATKILSWNAALSAIHGRTLLTVAAALGIGATLTETGTAQFLGEQVAQVGSNNPYLALTVVYAATVLCTELVTNNAAAAIMVPIALALAAKLGVDPMAFIVAVTIGASSSFMTPLGYQTNLMVYGPGGYRFVDFLRAGVPMTLIVGLTTLLLAPIIWPF